MNDSDILELMDRRFERLEEKLDKVLEMYAQRSIHIKIAVFFGIVQACVDMFLIGCILPATKPLFDFFKR